MNDKKLTILAVMAAVMLTWAVFQSGISTRPASSIGTLNTPLIQGLETSQIAAIILGRAGDGVTLKKQGDNFVVENKDNYPAMTEKINNLIADVLDIRIRELITKDSANHDDLDVTGEKAQHLVKFLDEAGELITGVIVGKRDSQHGLAYVRKLSHGESEDNTVFSTPKAPWLQTSAMSYIDKDLFKVEKKDIARVSVNGSDENYRITADEKEKGKITLQSEIPSGKKLRGTDYEQVFTAVTNLEFEDVQKESNKTSELKFDLTYVCELKDSTVCIFQLAQKDGKTYAKCHAKYTNDIRVTKKQISDASEEELKEQEAKLLARDAAEKFTQKHQGWVYKIADQQAGNMTKKFDDLLENKQEEKEEKQP